MQEIFYTLARDSAQIWQGIFPQFDKGFCSFGKGKCSLPIPTDIPEEALAFYNSCVALATLVAHVEQSVARAPYRRP